ncbi:MAG: metallophosphoesterase [Deltaproteobacteria bacterium]|nr:metallophosphoesterase [Deltaproteobacteria bacterium]
MATLLGQFVCLRLWLSFFPAKRVKTTIKIGFLVLNLAWALTAYSLKYHGHMDGQLWAVVGRPAISWQLVSVLLTIPSAALFLLFLIFKFLNWLAVGAKKVDKKTTQNDSKSSESKPSQESNQESNQESSKTPTQEPGKLPNDLDRQKLKDLREVPSWSKTLGGEMGRREFLKKAGAAYLLTTTAVCGYGLTRQALTPAITTKYLTFDNLPTQLDGFRIVQISDIHLGLWSNQRELAGAFAKAASVKPDLVVLTGDLVDQDPEYSKLFYEPLEQFDSVPHGVHAILGNHDHYTGPATIASLLGQRLNMMVDDRIILPGAPITIVGLDDPGRRGAWLRKRGKNLDLDPDLLDFSRVLGPPFRAGDFNLLLNHRPDGYRQASREGFDLYLVGHTHGGQYQIPFFSQYNLASLFYKYSSGLYHDHPTWLNVSRGLGSVGLPFRLFAWPEIDLIVLKKA